jgi:FAD/FMN-containing dehydrogenase
MGGLEAGTHLSLDQSALSAFRDTFAGEIVLPGDVDYDSARAVWNGMIDRRPAIVVRPADADDVALAIRFGRDQDLTLAVRGGGHSIPGLSTCDDGLVVDLSHMRGAQVDPERRLARVAGGAHLAELDDTAQANGLVCPVGVVSHTGVAGLTLGGGMGRLQRKLGLTIDNLAAADVVTADGRLVHASEDENPDLFWGLRGAGANFGVVTSFEFRLHPLSEVITHGVLMHPLERAVELAAVYHDVLDSGPDELWMSFGLILAPVENVPPEIAGEPVAAVSVLHCGPLDQAERDVAQLRAFGPPVVDSIEAKTYLSVQRMNDEALEWGHRFYMKSAFLPDLSDELVALGAEHASRMPEGADANITAWPCGRAIAAVGEDETAFTGRDAAFWIGAEIMWDDPALDDRCRDWGRAVLADIDRFASVGRYVNDVAETGEASVREVYGAEKYERLVALKRAWDPDNVFRLNQNVRP